jgi:glycogen synthase
MRILITTDTVGGVWDHTVTLARGLHGAGHQVLLAVLGEPRDARLAALPDGVEVTWRRYRLEWMPDAGADVAAAGTWLRATAALWQADVVHLNQTAYATAGFDAPTLAVVHSDVLSWYLETLGTAAPREGWAEYTRWVCDGLAAADVVAAPTAYQADLVRRHYGRSSVRVIHNGVDAPEREPAGRGPGVLALSVGRCWDEAKGAHVLDEAVGRLGDRAPETHLLGELAGPNGGAFVPRHLNAHGRVERGEVDAWMERADIYVAPSLYEPFGLAPLEAALRGCALLLSDIGSFRELWDGCAVFVPRGDAAALAGALAALAADTERRAALAVAARTRARRRYSAARMLSTYLGLYREMAAAVVGG